MQVRRGCAIPPPTTTTAHTPYCLVNLLFTHLQQPLKECGQLDTDVWEQPQCLAQQLQGVLVQGLQQGNNSQAKEQP